MEPTLLLPSAIHKADEATPPPSPYLEGTRIQFAYIKELAEWLIESAIPNDDCWDCHLTPSPKGYSYVSVGRALRLRVHRVVYMTIAGRFLSPDELVCHECDNRRCIHPLHLFLGTAKENTADMMAKSRGATDPNVAKRRREATAAIIRPYFEKGMSSHDIARETGLSLSTIWNYIHGPYSLSLLTGDQDTVCL